MVILQKFFVGEGVGRAFVGRIIGFKAVANSRASREFIQDLFVEVVCPVVQPNNPVLIRILWL
jgi:hypothetical protein